MASGRLQDEVSIVTGAASGFGKGITAKFVREGSKVVIADLAREAGVAAAQELGCKFVAAEVCGRSDWERLLSESLSEFGQLDIVVNNAATTYPNKATEDVTEDEFDMVFKVNVKSMFVSTAVLLPYFLKDDRPGCFLQVASTDGVRPRPRLTWYNATKGALITATKGMAAEYGPKGIRFNAISPGVGNTGMMHFFLGKPGTSENLAPFLEAVPLGRPAEPADVANACCYLASDEASLITGVNLEVDGGRCV